MPSIDKGSPAAWSTRRLLESFWALDEDGFERALDEAQGYFEAVLWNLTIVAGGTVNAIAMAVKQTYDELLPTIWVQLAERPDTEESLLMRAMVTAWTSGDAETVQVLNESGAIQAADLDALVMNFAGVTQLLVRKLCEITKEPTSLAEDSLWKWLGTE